MMRDPTMHPKGRCEGGPGGDFAAEHTQLLPAVSGLVLRTSIYVRQCTTARDRVDRPGPLG
jgi:hypothetical protein